VKTLFFNNITTGRQSPLGGGVARSNPFLIEPRKECGALSAARIDPSMGLFRWSVFGGGVSYFQQLGNEPTAPNASVEHP